MFFSCQRTKLVHRSKIEKEKREHAKQHGLIRTEISGGEIAEEMEKERRLFQLQMCEVRNVVIYVCVCAEQSVKISTAIVQPYIKYCNPYK